MIITATGLNMLLLGGMQVAVDGREIEFSETVGYKGMMFTRRAEPGGRARLHERLVDAQVRPRGAVRLPPPEPHGRRAATARPRRASPTRRSRTEPFLDLASGYVLRSIHTLPKQGSRAPWRLYQNYARDVLMMRRGPLEDEGIEFSNPRAPAEPAEPLAA